MSKGYFQNQYDECTEEASENILNDSKDGISEKFQNKLLNFKTTKLQLLTTKMECDIFHDGTVYTGSTGLALYYFTCSLKNDVINEPLKLALEYINLDNLKGKRISFLCGDAGPLALATVISYKLSTRRPDSLSNYKTLAQRLMSLISLLNDSPDELLYGKSGYLYALLFVNKHISGKEVIPANHIEKVIISILRSGKQYATHLKSESPMLWQWHDKIYFGAAHGMAGILYILLQARLYVNIIEIRSFIKPTLDWLLKQRFPSGNFPSSLSSKSNDRLVQWCHGAPGFVPLCIIASQIFEDEKYMRIALQCGDLIWQRGLSTKGYSICHGVSGNAYAFIQLYQATKFTLDRKKRNQFNVRYRFTLSVVPSVSSLTQKPVHLYRACCFMEWCAVERSGTELHHPDRPASLFEGLVGRLYLAEDITHVLDAKFPGLSV